MSVSVSTWNMNGETPLPLLMEPFFFPSIAQHKCFYSSNQEIICKGFGRPICFGSLLVLHTFTCLHFHVPCTFIFSKYSIISNYVSPTSLNCTNRETNNCSLTTTEQKNYMCVQQKLLNENTSKLVTISIINFFHHFT